MTKTFSEKLDNWRDHNNIGQCIVESYKEAQPLIEEDIKNILKTMVVLKGASVCKQQDNPENLLAKLSKS